jgi:hypothetical protein
MEFFSVNEIQLVATTIYNRSGSGIPELVLLHLQRTRHCAKAYLNLHKKEKFSTHDPKVKN